MSTRILLFLFIVLIITSCSEKNDKVPVSEQGGQNVLSLPKEDQERYNKESTTILADFTKTLNDYSTAMVNAKTSKEAVDLMQKSYDSFLTFTPRFRMMDSLFPSITSMDSTNPVVKSHLVAFQESMFRYNEAVNDLHILFGNDPEYKKMVKEMEERNKKPLK
ncbi:MAG: hypothetical protein JNL36_08825 [Candidatus Kapabacteria bacterium]|nr:hypothetical protein [Candidatus Kapabacteria bacterium]